jgi:hypothetical protein
VGFVEAGNMQFWLVTFRTSDLPAIEHYRTQGIGFPWEAHMTTMFDGSSVTQSPRGRCTASSASIFTFGRVIFGLCVLSWLAFASAAFAVSVRHTHAASDFAYSLSANFVKLPGAGSVEEALY